MRRGRKGAPPAKSPSSARAARPSATPACAAAAQPARAAGARRHRELRPAQSRHAPLRHRSRLWEIYVSAHNYGADPATSPCAGLRPAQRRYARAADVPALTLPAGGDAEASFEYRTAAAGILGVKMTPHDAFPADDQAELELPAQPHLSVTVYSDQPDLLRPVLSGHAARGCRLSQARRISRQRYRPGDSRSLHSPAAAVADSIWIAPPAEGSPIPVRRPWRTCRSPDGTPPIRRPPVCAPRISSSKRPRSSKRARRCRIGEVDAGPVIVAGRPSRRSWCWAFIRRFPHALRAGHPLLFANFCAGSRRRFSCRSEVGGASVGTVKLQVDQGRRQGREGHRRRRLARALHAYATDARLFRRLARRRCACWRATMNTCTR
jgi:hypothetical protein